MLPYALNPLQVNTDILSTPTLLEVVHDIAHFQEIFQDHTNTINKQ